MHNVKKNLILYSSAKAGIVLKFWAKWALSSKNWFIKKFYRLPKNKVL